MKYLPIGSVSASKFSAMLSFLIAFNKPHFSSKDFNELRFSSVIAKILLFSTPGVNLNFFAACNFRKYSLLFD